MAKNLASLDFGLRQFRLHARFQQAEHRPWSSGKVVQQSEVGLPARAQHHFGSDVGDKNHSGHKTNDNNK